MTGMDFETCVRAKIPILSILSNNFAMATEDDDMVLSRQKYGSTDISGNYSEFAKAMGGYGERVTEPDQILHALVRGIRMTQEGTRHRLTLPCKVLDDSVSRVAEAAPCLEPHPPPHGCPSPWPSPRRSTRSRFRARGAAGTRCC
jgi:hypothetical protein